MTYPDGWKDEEDDVDDSPKPEPLPPTVMSPPTSAQPCGCDPGAGWVCLWHQRIVK